MSGVEKVKSSLLNDVREIISAARSQAVRSVDSCRVQMYWHIGRRIFEEEQLGKDRADYGTRYVSYKESCQAAGAGVWQWFFIPSVGLLSSVLSSLSNCERIAFTIELDAVSHADSDRRFGQTPVL